MVSRWATAATLALLALLAGPAADGARAQDTGWVIDRFDSEIEIGDDGVVNVVETIQVDFSGMQRHGIYREIPIVYAYDDAQNRVLDLDLQSVSDGDGRGVPVDTTYEGANVRFRIGDPDRTVTGRQTYRIAYRMAGALNAFPEHDELYWNVTGAEWPVPIRSARATVTVPPGSLQRATCFEGAAGSDRTCDMAYDADRATFGTTSSLPPGEQLTVVVGIDKGVVPAPEPILRDKPRTPLAFFELGAVSLVGALLALVAGGALVGRKWWRVGRDRSYTSMYYLTDNPEERQRPLFYRDEVVVEYQPPEGLRPAEIGLLLDERADTKDVTATIIDLAVRGYLTITEVEGEGALGRRFGQKDWILDRVREDTADLSAYERIAFEGLFEDGPQVRLSELKEEYYATLGLVRDELYDSATERGWFGANPESARTKWLAAALVTAILGVGLAIGLGFLFGLGLVGVAVFLVGLAMIPLSRSMASRTALGSEMLRRALGFREYMVTAETDRQRFFEQAHIFAEYLPYAIVFGCVQRWARAFEGIEGAAEATGAWYYGPHYANPLLFSQALQGFNSNVTNVIASTPAASGGSGFSGGFSGGGFGGGGGGSW